VSVRQSVCPIDRMLQQRAAGLLLGAPRASDIDRLLHGAPVACPDAQQQLRRSSTAVSSKCEQRRVFSRRRRLNTDLSLDYSETHLQVLKCHTYVSLLYRCVACKKFRAAGTMLTDAGDLQVL